jgi:hypothetical protein
MLERTSLGPPSKVSSMGWGLVSMLVVLVMQTDRVGLVDAVGAGR